MSCDVNKDFLMLLNRVKSILLLVFLTSITFNIGFAVEQATMTELANKIVGKKSPEKFAISPDIRYRSVCANCHATGAFEAPRFGDKAEWDKRIVAVGGIDNLIKIATNGINRMPAKGGTQLSDSEFANVVRYISGQ